MKSVLQLAAAAVIEPQYRCWSKTCTGNHLPLGSHLPFMGPTGPGEGPKEGGMKWLLEAEALDE